jgi:predicted dehydrogenase
MVKPNLALVGLGYWGRNHYRVLNGLEEIDLKWACDSGIPKIKAGGNVRFTTQYQELIYDDSLQGVVLAVPTDAHYILGKEFLEAGKHVFIEKPLTNNTEQAEELCQIAQRKGVQLMVGDIFKFNAAVQFLKELIGKGELGNLRYLESRRVGLGPIRKDVSALWDLATHDIYLSRHFVGKKPISVNYQGVSHNGKVDDLCCINLKFPEEVMATIYVNWEHPIKERKFIVGGTEKAVLFDDVEPTDKITIFERGVDYQKDAGDFGGFQTSIRDGNIVIPRLKLTQPLEIELKHFVGCILGRETCLSDGKEGLETVKVLEAAEKSRQQKGLEVSLE